MCYSLREQLAWLWTSSPTKKRNIRFSLHPNNFHTVPWSLLIHAASICSFFLFRPQLFPSCFCFFFPQTLIYTRAKLSQAVFHQLLVSHLREVQHDQWRSWGPNVLLKGRGWRLRIHYSHPRFPSQADDSSFTEQLCFPNLLVAAALFYLAL